jgi:hypothetical protein
MNAGAAAPLSGPFRLLAWLVLCVGIGYGAWSTWVPVTEPFRFGFLAHNAARYALAGRNYVRDGFLAHGGVPNLTPGRVPRDVSSPDDVPPRIPYVHHPPLAPIVVGLAFAALGESERAAQLPFWIAGIGVPLLLFVLARRLLRGIGPHVAAAVCGGLPIAAIYGGHVDPQGPFVVLGVLVMLLGWLRCRARGGASWPWLAAGGLALGLLSDWSAAYAAGFLALAEFVRRGTRADRRVLLLPVLCVAFVLAFIAWIRASGLSVGGDFTGSAGIRSWTALTLPGVKLGAELAKWCGGVVAMFTPAALVLTVLAAIPALRRRARVEGSEFERVLAVLLATGFAHVVLFPAGAFIHDYWTFLLVPGVALACGAVIESMRAAAERRFGEGFGVLVVLASLAAIGVSAVASREAWYGREGDPRHAIHAQIGTQVRGSIALTERVLTNIPFYNPTRSDLLVYPEFSFAADRVVRGNVRTEADVERAIAEEGPFDVYLSATWTGVEEAPVVASLASKHPERAGYVMGQRVRIFELTKTR